MPNATPTTQELVTLLRIAAECVEDAPARTAGAAYLKSATIQQLTAAADALSRTAQEPDDAHFTPAEVHAMLQANMVSANGYGTVGKRAWNIVYDALNEKYPARTAGCLSGEGT